MALAALGFVALALTGTLPLPPPENAGATQYCTEYMQYQYSNTCGQPLVPPLITFQSNRDASNNPEVYIMNPNGSTQTRLFANTNQSDGSPTWSPDGTKIAFQSTRDGNTEIYVMDVQGNGQTRLTSNPAADSVPNWSPDGTKIAFASNRDGVPNVEIYVMNPDGSGQTRLTNNPANDNLPNWSPDGTKIAFSSNRDGTSNTEIYLMNADGSGQTRLTNNTAADTGPAWSPDGTKIAFYSTRDGNNEIYVMNADGSGQTRLTNNPAFDVAPTWSPDGQKIAFSSTRDVNFQIYAMNADGSGQTRLTNNTATDVQPNWQRAAPGAPTGVSATAGNGQATVSFTAPTSTGGAATSSYTVTAAPGGAHASGPGSPITVTGLANGATYTFTVTATNRAGTGPPSAPSNAVTPMAPDTTPPTAAPTQAPPANGAGWNSTDVTVTWHWIDPVGGSGIDPANCTTSSTSSGEGASIVLHATCKDLAGNTGRASYTVKVDKTAPTIVAANVTVDATSPAGATVAYTVTASDNLDPSPIVVCQPISGSLFPIGTTTVDCTATDAAGNIGRRQFTVHVANAAEQLDDLLERVTGVGPGSSLEAKVTAIQDRVAAGNRAGACGPLGAFVNQVNAQTGKKLTVAQAAALVEQAENIKATLGC